MIFGKNISWSFPNKKSAPILQEVSFELQQGRLTTFMGQSGAGKTTLLKCIANLHAHYSGSITYAGKEIKSLQPIERAAAVGFVPQQFHLFPHFTVLQNCTHALVKTLGVNSAEADQCALETLQLLQMHPWAHAYPSQLSGGQQQRGAIARALVLKPQILLLDEPTSALDPENKQSLIELLQDLKARGITIGLSSHDMPFIKKMLDLVYFLEGGKLIETFDLKLDEIASKPRIQQFINHH
jgi:ABC-type polar amino acid transport system ATPase subunit